MHANTLAILGLPPSASDAQIASALQNPTPGRPAQAWNTEIQERMKMKGENYQTAWAACQALDDPLYQCYLRDCEKRNGQAAQAESDKADAVIREGESFDAEDYRVPDGRGGLMGARAIPTANARRQGGAGASRTANAADVAFADETMQSLMEELTPLRALALKHFLEKYIAQLGN